MTADLPPITTHDARAAIVRYERRFARPFDLLACRPYSRVKVLCRVREHLELFIPQEGYEGLRTWTFSITHEGIQIA